MTNSAVFQRSVSPYATRATGIHERPPMTSTSVAEAVPRIRRLRRDGPEERSRERERPDGDEDRERGDAQPAHVRRIRGSIRVYARSTARLATTAIAATTTVRPVTSG